MYDLIVIGAGPGGYVAAIRAAQLGMQVACIEKSALGGTCLNVGCIPSKALLDSSELYYEAKHSFERHGIRIQDAQIDVPAMIARKDKVVDIMNRGVAGLFKKNNIDSFIGLGRILDANTVEMHNRTQKTLLQGKHILIATGSAPVELPHIKFNGKTIISSTEALTLTEVPESLLVVGAGAIGLEMGSVWSRLGSDVLVVELQPQIVPDMDQEMTKLLKRSLEKQGFKFLMQSSVEECIVEKGRVHARIKTPEGEIREIFDKALIAVGRKPFMDQLGLEDVGVRMDPRGRIEVDKRFETNIKGIFAIGDVIPGPMLAHKAEEEGVAAVELMAGKAGHVNYKAIPGVVYTYPELASVGISEETANEQAIPYKVGKFPLKALGRAHAMDAIDGMVKVISHKVTDRLLGLHILAPRASDIIAEGALAMEFSASAEDIGRSVHAHPTLPEAIKEAALAVDGQAIHI